ncbi:hypothetical protein [Nocardiopsis composta]|uniref:Uncharacterized protein n=1 Tax=Nocardiopsis composta TaxID=157465 RepID=A0A7W8QIX7_9ACTN|nr:hypothetical protein [Nocardiopsis composta]MBB5431089.1 hypothetical protein [Nocardiopsis composta]
MTERFRQVAPEDVLPDGVEGADFGGVRVRKGTVKAAIDNIRALDGLEPGGAEHRAAVAGLREAMPALRALGLFEVFRFRDPAVAELLEG